MPEAKKVHFRINAYTPQTIPMDRLALYMREFAHLLGEPASVHFDELIAGSACIVASIEHTAIPKVEERLTRTASGDPPADARQAIKALDDMLASDNTDGVLSEADGATLLPFPGVTQRRQLAFGPFNQAGTLDGVVIRVGGRGDPVPVMLETRDGFETHCIASRGIAKGLAAHLFDGEVRCTGVGRWHRDAQGNWLLDRFTISGFEPLDNRPLGDVVRDLQMIEGNAWREAKDVWKEAADLRDDGDE